MILIIGLGNPGKKYLKTRHNIGFRIIDEFAKKNNFSEFSSVKKADSLVSQTIFNSREAISDKIILAKPQTFMNNSGKAVKMLIKNRDLNSKNLIVIHDDIDLALGKIRISKNRGSAGHKGVESIIKEIGTKNFTRIRIGIKPEQKTKVETEKFVLQKFLKDEEKIVKKTTQTAIIQIKKIGGVELR